MPANQQPTTVYLQQVCGGCCLADRLQGHIQLQLAVTSSRTTNEDLQGGKHEIFNI